MTSRDPSRRKSWDQLDTMIRWTMRESVREVTPPPGLWDRIKEQVLGESETRWSGWMQGFRLGAEALALSILASVADARSEAGYPALAACCAWNGECLCWSDEYGILLRRLAVL